MDSSIVNNSEEAHPVHHAIRVVTCRIGKPRSEGGQWTVLPRQRHLEHEDAPFAGDIADVDVAVMRLDGLARDRKTETEARPIVAASIAEGLEQIALGRRNA